ncbi:hypothetical protein DE146DRAFT_626482 [Phaeosphaeria sp. MPI-PUGE-AT-0046c]|nr:hypothetical protein DE146DRAFT_626482 [Phaeosphaeria sp. MPI-PUGE-AT-0046c]
MLSTAWPIFTTVLLLITYLPSAMCTSTPQFTQFASKRTGCMQQRGLFYKLLPLPTETDPELYFAIKTGYTAYYPKVLQNAVQVAGFKLLTLSTSECGWQKARSAIASASGEVGRHRGDIYWKYIDLHWAKSNGTENALQWIAASPDHIPPNTGVLPRDETLDALERVLLDNEPAADVFVLVTICLSYVSGFLAFYLLALVAISRMRHFRKSNPEMSDSEDIELGAMKDNGTATLAANAPPAMPVAVPRYMVRSPRDFSESGSANPPPPRYSAILSPSHIHDEHPGASPLKQAYGLTDDSGLA